MFGSLSSIFSSILPVLSVGATAYSSYKNYKKAKSQTAQLKAQNTRNAKLQEGAIRRAKARNLAAMSASGLRVTGTPSLMLQEDEELAQQDLDWQRQTNYAAEQQAEYNTKSALFGGAAQVYKYGRALE